MNNPHTGSDCCRKPTQWLWLLPLALASVSVSAQDEANEDIFELSPFTVEAATGYTAQNTLSGTRLKSSLKDIPQQISVLTAEFLEDVAATNPQDAMLYSLNVENLTEYADPANGQFNAGIGFNNFSGRVRGIASAGRMRDFFQTDLQGDNYNLENITISSGPNAVIYGLAGTGGTINTGMKKAVIGDDFYSLETRVDSEGSNRFVFDANKSLIEDKLAFRFIALQDDFQTYRNGSDGEQDRMFFSLTARPWKGAFLQTYYEDVDIYKSLPRNVVAYDGGITAYREHVANGGDPYYDNSIGTSILPGWEGVVQKYNNNREHWVLQSPDGNVVNIGPASGGTFNTVRTIAPSTQAPNPSDRFRGWSLPPDDPIVSVEHNVHGLTTGRNMYGDIQGVVFNQVITENLAFEIGYNQEKGFTDFYNMAMPGAALIRVDPNMYLPDGVTPNPNRGLPYVEHWGQSTTDYNELEGFRSTLSYKLDLSENNKWLGNHNFMALYTDDRHDRFWSWMRTKTVAADDVNSYKYSARWGAADGQTNYRWYLDPDTYEMVNPFDPLLGGSQPDGSFVWARGNAPASGFTWNSLQQRRGITGAVQSYWLDDRLTTTYGYRKGYFRNGSATVGVVSNDDVAWGRENIRDIDRSLDNWGDETSEDAINFGAVYDVTTTDNQYGGWSVFYNWADIFNSPTAGHFADGSGIPAAIGESYDYGIIWTGADNRVGAKFNWYKTESANVNNCGWCNQIRNNVVNIEQQIGADGRESFNENNYADAIADGLIADADGNLLSAPVAYNPGTFDLEQVLSYWHMTASRVSEGLEIEAWANPTNNWTFRFTAAKNESTDVDGLQGWGDYINERYSYWQQWANWEQTAYREGSTDPVADGGGSVTNRFNNLAPAYVTINNSDGVRVNQNAGWRVNLTGRYTFTEGRMKGTSIGGVYRFRESPVIGYLSLPADTPFAGWPDQPAQFTAPSLDDPVSASSRKDFDMFASYRGSMTDKIDYTIRLNVRNVFDDDDVMAQRALSDGTTAVYTFKTPRSVILSLRLSY